MLVKILCSFCVNFVCTCYNGTFLILYHFSLFFFFCEQALEMLLLLSESGQLPLTQNAEETKIGPSQSFKLKNVLGTS